MVKKVLDHKISRTAAKILQIKLQILLFLLLPIIVFTLVISKTELIKGFGSYIVLTGSMEPTIPVGSIIYTKSAIGYGVDDIVAFKNAADQTVTHRITDLSFNQNTEYTTKGDANNTVDATPVTTDKIVGKVYVHIPYVGYIMNFLRTPKGFVLVVIVPVALFVLLELWNIKREMEKSIEKKMREKYQNQQITVSS